MEITSLFTYILVPLYIGIAVYIANQLEQEKSAQSASNQLDFSIRQRMTIIRWMLFGLVASLFLSGLLLLQAMLLSSSLQEVDIDLPPIDTAAGAVGFGVAVVVGFICLRLVNSESTRLGLRRFTGSSGLFDPQSSVHLVALVLLLWYIAISFIFLIMAGGVGGLAQSIEETGISAAELVFQGGLLLVLALLGVGLAIRRNIPQTLMRLGLSLPSLKDTFAGVASGIGLMILAGLLIQIWGLVVSPEQFAEQSSAANEIGRQVNSLALAFVLSITAAVSEEILFRGALQPVFGLPLTALFFTLFHNQYTLTPAALIIFVVGLALGYLRQRYNTSTAIITHFIYNFLPFAMLFLLPQVAERMGIS